MKIKYLYLLIILFFQSCNQGVKKNNQKHEESRHDSLIGNNSFNSINVKSVMGEIEFFEFELPLKNNKYLGTSDVDGVSYLGPSTVELNKTDILLLETYNNSVVVINNGKIVRSIKHNKPYGYLSDIIKFNNQIYLVTTLGDIMMFDDEYNLLIEKEKICYRAGQSKFYIYDDELYLGCPINDTKLYRIDNRANIIPVDNDFPMSFYDFRSKNSKEMKEKLFRNDSLVKFCDQEISLKKRYKAQGLGGSQFARNDKMFIYFEIAQDSTLITFMGLNCR